LIVLYHFCVYLGGATCFFFDSNFTDEIDLKITNSSFINNSIALGIQNYSTYSGDVYVYINKSVNLFEYLFFICSDSSDLKSIISEDDTAAYFHKFDSCSSKTPEKKNDSCFCSFLSLNGSSCVWSCGKGEVGVFDKCYENCNLKNVMTSSHSQNSCDSTC
jgi:hypothetical protein